jgi:hypothetical protein
MVTPIFVPPVVYSGGHSHGGAPLSPDGNLIMLSICVILLLYLLFMLALIAIWVIGDELHIFKRAVKFLDNYMGTTLFGTLGLCFVIEVIFALLVLAF